MRKFLKYLRIGFLCGWRVVFEYFQWILPCSRHPERKPIAYRYGKARRLVTFLLSHMGFDLKLGDTSPLIREQACLYVCNHLSALDPLLLVALSPTPVSFISKKENRKIIIAGRLIAAIGGIFIDREDPFQTMREFKVAVAGIRNGVSYCIFPEGTRQRDPYSAKTLPFHPGSLKLAFLAKCPVVSCVGFGSFHAFDATKGLVHRWDFSCLKEYDNKDYAPMKTVGLCDDIQAAIDARLPALVEADRAYEAHKKKDKPAKWWKNLPA